MMYRIDFDGSWLLDPRAGTPVPFFGALALLGAVLSGALVLAVASVARDCGGQL